MQRPRKPADPDYTLCDEPISLGESATVDQAGGYDGEGEEVPWRPRAVAARRALAAIRRSSVAQQLVIRHSRPGWRAERRFLRCNLVRVFDLAPCRYGHIRGR